MFTVHKGANDDSARRHMRNIVTNTQLKDIAATQSEEIAQLAAQLAALRQRSFPDLVYDVSAVAPGVLIPSWSPPDFRPSSSSFHGSRPTTAAARRAGSASGQVGGMTGGKLLSPGVTQGI